MLKANTPIMPGYPDRGTGGIALPVRSGGVTSQVRRDMVGAAQSATGRPMLSNTATSVLARLPMLEVLSLEILEQIAAGARRRTFRRGEVLCHEGDPGDALVVIVNGT